MEKKSILEPRGGNFAPNFLKFRFQLYLTNVRQFFCALSYREKEFEQIFVRLNGKQIFSQQESTKYIAVQFYTRILF